MIEYISQQTSDLAPNHGGKEEKNGEHDSRLWTAAGVLPAIRKNLAEHCKSCLTNVFYHISGK